MGTDEKRSEYCSKHRRFFRSSRGCEICTYEGILAGRKEDSIPWLQKCPRCGEITLIHHRCSNRYECLNFDCTLGDMESE